MGALLSSSHTTCSNHQAQSRDPPPMASRLSTTTLSLVFCFIFSSVSIAARSVHSDSDNKVSLDFYYESLCPYCSNFMVNYLPKLFEDDLITIVDLKLVPWGNAKRKSNNTFTCQHGPSECLLNTVEACAIYSWPNLGDHFPFIYCVENLVYQHKYPEWESCFEKLGLDPKLVSECYASGFGEKLELQYGTETEALHPPHTYVPWVVIDGHPIYEDYRNFITYICAAYRGSKNVKACSEISLKSIQTKKSGKHVYPVCYKDTELKRAASM